MRPFVRQTTRDILARVFASSCLLLGAVGTVTGQQTTLEGSVGLPGPLPLEYLQVQGLQRAVRLYIPERLADRPALVLVLHGSGGDGERFRRFTATAFERVADTHGFVVAYPDALGGQWNDCRSRALYHQALAGIDEIAFLRAVVRRAQAAVGRDLAGTFTVGYSNGGHLVFRLAFEAPQDFLALAAIGAHLPVPEERDCHSSGTPVSILIASGTEDPINPWAGGNVQLPGGITLGGVLSAAQTTEYFRTLAGITGEAVTHQHPDRDTNDGASVETQRWLGAASREVVLMVTHGGGHTLPHPDAQFPIDVVGRTSRDIDGANEIWNFFARHLRRED